MSQRKSGRKRSGQIPWWKNLWRQWSVLRLLLWTIWVIYRERRRVVKAHERGNYEVQPNIEVLIEVLTAFRHTAIKLGVLMIKLGQFLSSRADLLPERALAVLASLQDEVPAEPYEHVVDVIESELGKPIEKLFTKFERGATAAASLGQVHKAELITTGEAVAVKVQRPNIEQLVRMDLGTLKFAIWLITRFIDPGDFIDLWGIYREFRRTVFEEIDFMGEASNARRFREMFKDNPAIYIPRFHDQYSTRRVIVMEWIDGIKINDYATLDAFGFDRMEVARRTVSSYFHQIFEAGFFHADPHPGNIFVKRGSDPDEPIIAFVDFGMVGSITKPMKRALKELFVSVITSDAHGVVNALIKLGFIGKGANIIAVEQALELMLEQYYGMTLGQIRELDMRDMAQEIVQLLYGQPFHIPAQFAFTGRAVSTLVGVSTGLAPNFNFVEVAVPYAREFLGLGAESVGETVQDIGKQLLETGKVVMGLPKAVERLITRIDSGQVEVRLANFAGGKRARGREKGNGNTVPLFSVGSGNFSMALVFLGALAGGIYLTSMSLGGPGWFCLGVAAVTALGMLVKR